MKSAKPIEHEWLQGGRLCERARKRAIRTSTRCEEEKEEGGKGRGRDKVRMKDRGDKVRMMVRGDMVKEKGSYGSGYGKGFPWRCEWLVVIDSVVFV